MATIVILGPTGVGKTALAESLATKINGAIINADSAQFYRPLTIGTAKPVYAHSTIEHYCFDIVDEPVNYSVAAYRQEVIKLLPALNARQLVPIIVGGSGFYVKSLIWPPAANMNEAGESALALDGGGTSGDGWQQLQEIDPVRAAQIHPHDTYRLMRALTIWRQTGKKPSEYKPLFEPVDDMLIVWLNRERAQLNARIDERVVQMMANGWIEEVASLGPEWQAWLREKKIIGYDDILAGTLPTTQMIQRIARRTRLYAKGQITFWKSFKRQLDQALQTYSGLHTITVMEIDLTLAMHDLYINQLLAQYMQMIGPS